MAKRATLQNIAEMVGVSKVTVSNVLRGKMGIVKIRPTTREKIFSVAKRLNYEPNAAAIALATRKTGHIGFILSDSVTDDWANAYFARQFSGVEKICRERGYGLNASLYNLSNIDSFVFPKKVSQRSVDGLILTGYVESAVIHRFREFEIPCVCIGDNLEVAELIPAVSMDIVGGLYQAVGHAVSLGHHRIMFDSGSHRRDREVSQLLIKRTRVNPETSHCQVMLSDIPESLSDYSTAKPLMEYWLGLPETQRPTVIIATDQTLQAFLKEMRSRGLRCPEDISLISTCDTHLCEYSDPSLTAVRQGLAELGRIAADMLIDHLEKGKLLTAEMSRNDFECKLIVRESCSKINSV